MEEVVVVVEDFIVRWLRWDIAISCCLLFIGLVDTLCARWLGCVGWIFYDVRCALCLSIKKLALELF
jgi:hypothetical protein